MGRESRIVCSCLGCQALVATHGLDLYSCFAFGTPPLQAVSPRCGPFSEKTRTAILSIFDVPERWEHVDQTDLQNQMIAFGLKSQPPPGSSNADRVLCSYCKLVDPIERYQAGELIVFESGDYFYSTINFFEKRQEGDETIYEFIDFTDTDAGRDLPATVQRLFDSFKELSPGASGGAWSPLGGAV